MPVFITSMQPELFELVVVLCQNIFGMCLLRSLYTDVLKFLACSKDQEVRLSLILRHYDIYLKTIYALRKIYMYIADIVCVFIMHGVHSVHAFTGVWEQWDTIVYPREAETPHGIKVAPEGLLDFLAQKVAQNFSADDDTLSQQITDDPENQELADERCLFIYLQSHQKRLVHCELSSSAGISKIVDTVQKIFDQLQTRKHGLLSTSGDQYYFTKNKCNSSQRLTVVIGHIYTLIQLLIAMICVF